MTELAMGGGEFIKYLLWYDCCSWLLLVRGAAAEDAERARWWSWYTVVVAVRLNVYR